MSVVAVFTKEGELHHKPTLPPRLVQMAFRVDTHTHRGQMRINVHKCNCLCLTGALANLERKTSERSSFVGLHDPGSQSLGVDRKAIVEMHDCNDRHCMIHTVVIS